jgi:putative ABC transport system substrate-binding protein
VAILRANSTSQRGCNACVGVLALLVLSATAGAAPPHKIALFYPAESPYRAAAKALRAQLDDKTYSFTVIEAAGDRAPDKSDVQRVVAAKPDLIVAGGTRSVLAAREALPNVPVVYFMVPNILDTPLAPKRGRPPPHTTGVTSDVDPNEQLDWILRTSPRARRIAIPCSSRTKATVAGFKQAAARRGVSIVPIECSIGEFANAVDKLKDARCDGVLMIPDAAVYNRANVQQLLLWGVRSQKPIWTFSTNIVKAGAYAGVYSQNEVVGRQTAEIVKQIVAGKQPDDIGLQYPQAVGRAVNMHTAQRIEHESFIRELPDGIVRVGESP